MQLRRKPNHTQQSANLMAKQRASKHNSTLGSSDVSSLLQPGGVQPHLHKTVNNYSSVNRLTTGMPGKNQVQLDAEVARQALDSLGAKSFQNQDPHSKTQPAQASGPKMQIKRAVQETIQTKDIDVLIIGAGPAALGLLINSFKSQRYKELLHGDSIAVVDEGTSFGGGNLGSYGVNSNTSAYGFVKCCHRRTKDKENKTPDKDKEDGQETPSQDEILPAHRELFQSSIGVFLRTLNKSIAPLSFVGHFLNYAGNHLLYFIHQAAQKKVFWPKTKAISIQLMPNGTISTKVQKTEFSVQVDPQTQQVTIVEHSTQILNFRSKAIVICNGASQSLPPDFNYFFPNMAHKCITSDSFLKKEQFNRQLTNLRHSRQPPKIVIIGGSHSGFSCAWLLLNGHAALQHGSGKPQQAIRKTIKNCSECCNCPAVTAKPPTSAKSKCRCICKCFGYFKYEEWPQSEVLDQCQIQILYRDKIKVFFKNSQEAEQEGYEDYDMERDRDGYIYAFTGLRGDAKQLWIDVVTKQEMRVSLIRAETAQEQFSYVQKADLVIWACGYQTKQIPIYDAMHKPVRLACLPEGAHAQFEVDHRCRVLLEGNQQVLAKVFACGVGYPIRTQKDGGYGEQLNPYKNPKADSFSLYMNVVADTILKNLLPKTKISNTVSHYETIKDPFTQLNSLPQYSQDPPPIPVASTTQIQEKKRSKSSSYFTSNPNSKLLNLQVQNNPAQNMDINSQRLSQQYHPGMAMPQNLMRRDTYTADERQPYASSTSAGQLQTMPVQHLTVLPQQLLRQSHKLQHSVQLPQIISKSSFGGTVPPPLQEQQQSMAQLLEQARVRQSQNQPATIFMEQNLNASNKQAQQVRLPPIAAQIMSTERRNPITGEIEPPLGTGRTMRQQPPQQSQNRLFF